MNTAIIVTLILSVVIISLVAVLISCCGEEA